MWWIPVILAVLLQTAAADSHVKTSKLNIALRCHHSEQETWQSQVVFKHDSQGSDSSAWDVDVDQATYVCEGGKSILETTINLEAPGNVKPTTQDESESKESVEPRIVPPPDYELFRGVGYYKFHHDVANWPTARDRCAAEGGHLIIVNSEAEMEVVRKLYVQLNPTSVGSSQQEQIHTGVKRTDDGKHVTIFGTPLEKTGFSTWHPGQPSSGAAEPCVSIMRETLALNDISCSKQILAFICEIESGVTRDKPRKLVTESRGCRKAPPGYQAFPGVGSYKFHHQVATWPGARDRCAAEGGHLVVINSEAEREVVRKLFAEQNPVSCGSSNPDQIHTGLKRTDDGKHVTIFGTPLEKTGFSTWYPGQPNSGAAEPCVSIMRQDISLNDISCQKQMLAFICELVPEGENPTQQQLVEIETTEKPARKVPPGYELFEGVGHYKFHHQVTNWPTARDRCAAEGGHLVIINSEAEREVVRQLFAVRNPSSEGSSNSDQVHTGLSRTHDGKHVTLFGTPISETGFSTWYPGQPSSGAAEPCVSIMRQNITFNDISCEQQILAFICELAP